MPTGNSPTPYSTSRPVLRGSGLGNEARLPDIFPCACTMSSRSWEACVPSSCRPLPPLDQAQIDVERLRHLLWNGDHEKACEALGRIVSRAKDASC